MGISIQGAVKRRLREIAELRKKAEEKGQKFDGQTLRQYADKIGAFDEPIEFVDAEPLLELNHASSE